MDKRMLPYRRRLGDRRGNRQPLASASRGGRDGTVFHDPPSQTLPHYQILIGTAWPESAPCHWTTKESEIMIAKIKNDIIDGSRTGVVADVQKALAAAALAKKVADK